MSMRNGVRRYILVRKFLKFMHIFIIKFINNVYCEKIARTSHSKINIFQFYFSQTPFLPNTQNKAHACVKIALTSAQANSFCFGSNTTLILNIKD